MAREISLSGGDISILKALGMSGSSVDGDTLVERLKDMEAAELIDALQGLMMMDYVFSDIQTLRKIEDVKKANFKVNAGCLKELKEAIVPGRKEPDKGRRQRRG